MGRLKRAVRRLVPAPPPAPEPPPRTRYGTDEELARAPGDTPASAAVDPAVADIEITPADVAARLAARDTGMSLVDVRETIELVYGGIIPGAAHIPMSQFDRRTGELDRATEVVCYCEHGVRSLSVAAYLRSLGFQSRSMSGGICAWPGDRAEYRPPRPD